MKKILIIYPHFPPSNLAGVHRPRLFAQHLPAFGWQPVILTVHEQFYEEALDHNLEKLLPASLRIEKVKAFPITKPRLVGDLGLRAFFQLYRKAKHLIQSEKIDLVYIPIPSFYCALLGRWLNKTTGIKYGIDYIDPWVHHFPGSDKIFSRHWFSAKLAKTLEPIAIKKAALITGVAEGYYLPVFDRNPHLKKQVVYGAMPYGGEREDHLLMEQIGAEPYLFKKNSKLQIVYAGAMLPKAYAPLEAIFKSIASNSEIFCDVEIHFIGTGRTPDDPNGYNVKPLAEQFGIWNSIIYEYPKRIPYLDVLVHLNIADGIFILGSTEPHYTPSKTYQGVLSGKPILAVLNKNSSAVQMLLQSSAGIVLSFDGEKEVKNIQNEFAAIFNSYKQFSNSFDIANVDTSIFEKYSAENVTSQLARLLNLAIKN